MAMQHAVSNNTAVPRVSYVNTLIAHHYGQFYQSLMGADSIVQQSIKWSELLSAVDQVVTQCTRYISTTTRSTAAVLLYQNLLQYLVAITLAKQ
jgi:acyl-CoA synthetase (AMP-forming)/AMP-acid ligase II